MSETNTIDFHAEIPEVLQAMLKVSVAIKGHGLDRKLYHLVQLRASQINGCAFCVKMHTQEARQDGETNARLDRLIVWPHVDDFTEREKAALAWTEALTTLNGRTDYGLLRARLAPHFSPEEMAALTAAIGMINFWNRSQVANH
jgi:AhpD family alkylhydroperoxidase